MKKITTSNKISTQELMKMAQNRFGDLVKAVVDIKNKVMLVDAELHSDQEAELLRSGSVQEDLWGINLYPELFETDDFIEFDSMINLRPSWGNKTRGVDDATIREQIKKLVLELVM